ncbi:MAG TPA: insulinase family protein, partial [Polyangia bacterium]|nr:insulinase family protein [Polyangia bacterium]
IVKVIDEELENLRTKPVEPRELERAKNQLEFDLLRSLEAPLARAERLQIYNLQTGDPGYLARDLTGMRAVDAAAVQAAAAQFLRKDGRLIVTVTPNPDAPIMGRVKTP